MRYRANLRCGIMSRCAASERPKASSRFVYTRQILPQNVFLGRNICTPLRKPPSLLPKLHKKYFAQSESVCFLAASLEDEDHQHDQNNNDPSDHKQTWRHKVARRDLAVTEGAGGIRIRHVAAAASERGRTEKLSRLQRIFATVQAERNPARLAAFGAFTFHRRKLSFGLPRVEDSHTPPNHRKPENAYVKVATAFLFCYCESPKASAGSGNTCLKTAAGGCPPHAASVL